LRVFIGGHLLEDFVRPMLPEFYEEHPQLQMNFLPEKARDQILHDIQTGKIDVAVITVSPDEKPPGSLNIGTVTAGVYGTRNFRGPFTPEAVSALPFVLPAAGTQLTASMLRELEKHGVIPSRVIGFFPYHDVRIRLVCRGKGVTFSVQSVIDRHDPRGQLRLLFPTTPWEQRLYINPRVEPASATAVASFVTRALSSPAESPKTRAHHE
jgi:DNA-binding transcriptional LysR family regulator